MTYADELVEYPLKALLKIAENKDCIGLLLNKAPDSITDEDMDFACDNKMFDYSFVNSTTQEVSAYIFIEADVFRVENRQIKNLALYVTIACHKDFMRLDPEIFPSTIGNRRENLARHIDSVLNFSDIFGIGELSLYSIKTGNLNTGFTVKELEYRTPDFHKGGGLL